MHRAAMLIGLLTACSVTPIFAQNNEPVRDAVSLERFWQAQHTAGLCGGTRPATVRTCVQS